MRVFLAGLLLAICGGAQVRAADLLASGPIFGYDAQSVGVCYLINLGSTSVTLQSIGIYLHDGNTLISSISNNCGASLAAGKTCRTVSNIVANYYLCRAIVGTKTNIRGDFEERSGSLTAAHQSLR